MQKGREYKDQTCDGDMTAISVQTGMRSCVCVCVWCTTENFAKFQFLLLFLMSVLISQRQHLYTRAACFH